jgi:hypothetical protein
MTWPPRALLAACFLAGTFGPAAPSRAEAPASVAAPPLVLRAVADASGVYATVYDAEAGERSLVRFDTGGAMTVLVRSPRVERLALDGERVYWVGEDGVQSVSKQGGRVRDLAPRDWTLLPKDNEPTRWAVAVDAEGVYFSIDGGVGRVPKQGGEAELLASGADAMLFAVDDAEVWWLGAHDVVATPKRGGPSRRVLAGVTGVLAAVADDDALYVLAETERRGVGTIARAAKATGEAVTLARDVPTYYANVLAVDGESLFWLEYPSGLHGPMRVRTMPRRGGAAVTLAEPFPPANELLVDPARVTWAQDGLRSVARAPARGGGPAAVARWPM